MVDERIKYRHLQCFLAVAQHGSLQKAADVLAVTQPAVSKTLKELEDLLAVRLFERGRRGAVPTREGEAFLRHAGASVSALREAVASVAQTRRQGNAVVAIGVLPTVAPWLMPKLLLRQDAEQGEGAHTSLRIHTGANPELLARLRQRELDLVIGRFAEPAHMLGLSFEHLYADPLVLAVRPGHPLLAQDELKADVLAGLQAFTVILPTQGTAIRHTADGFFLSRGLALPARSIETLSVSIARGYTLRSDAVWVSPLGAVRPELDSGMLRQLPVSMAGTEELVGLTLRADMAPTPAQQGLIANIRQLAAERRSEATPQA
ncbi:pca operon transcription factor PcaQ [Polaromonas sp. CF318]|uniref:pca operon transcription factor PcaQ n=1 Tax=Polaromonas sp. CF318 TaxID=1144318 RepID=UPI00027100EF|nr:pca operon transcription factor PcaQ [Polaromonas sp. CF318]EJL86554.1 pca operon transcription factor PcaQ [Polaromonas sp. CF318]